MQLSSLLLALGALAGSSQVRVESGRADLIVGQTLRSITGASGAVELDGLSYLEFGPESRIEVRWSGSASARVSGPASIEVDPGSAPLLRLAGFGTAELEVRQGSLGLELAGGISLELAPGAVQVRALPGGAFELFHRGGEPLKVRRAGKTGVETIPGGKRVRLRPLPA